MTGSRMDNCACRLHDEGWDVVLPEEAMPFHHHHNRPKPSESFWHRKGFWPWSHLDSTEEENLRLEVGTISKADSQERIEALERREEWLKRRIIGMKALGMDNWTVTDIWQNAEWSGWGMLARPRGWETMWERWATEMGIDLTGEQGSDFDSIMLPTNSLLLNTPYFPLRAAWLGLHS